MRRAMNCGGWILCLLLLPAPASAQSAPRCAFLCAPELKIEPTWTIENLAARPRVEVDGQQERVARESVFELIFALDVPTTIPRVGLTLEAIFIPFGGTSVHPFTGATADEAGRDEIRDNGIEIEAEVNIELFGTEQTGGWISSACRRRSTSSAPARHRGPGACIRTSSTSSGIRPSMCSIGCRKVTGCATSRQRSHWTTSPQGCPKRATSLEANAS